MSDERSQSLHELVGPWDEPVYPSHLGGRIHELWGVPLAQFGTEDLRIVIGQKRGLAHLVPIAIDRLEAEPLAEGDFYPGDLLAVVLRLEPSFWSTRPDLHKRLGEIVARARTESDLTPDLESLMDANWTQKQTRGQDPRV